MFDVRLRVNRLEKKYILKYEQAEIQEGLIMFYGDSAFTRWSEKWGYHDMEEDIRMKDGSRAVINHGFGTSTAEELLYYYDRMVKPWKPRALVLNVFSNDCDNAYSPEEIMALLERIMEWARNDIPGIKFYLCEARPLKAGIEGRVIWHFQWHNMQLEYNELVNQYAAKHDDCKVVSYINHPLFFNNPEDVGDYKIIRTDTFIEDDVHLSPFGYELFAKFWREELDELL